MSPFSRMRLAVALLLAWLVASACWADEISDKLKEHMAKVAEDGKFSGAALVMKEGKPLLREAYGKANYELEVTNTVDTKFRLGSITKQFTAMAVMILAERGKLQIDDPISKHLKDCPESWKGISIRHLLTHTSGIPSYTGFPQMMTRTVRLPATVDEIIATFKDKELEFAPGDKFTYSNSGYIVLGKIIEQASGQEYDSFLRQNVLLPLEMSETGYDQNAAILPRRAAGYARVLGVLANAPYIDMTWPHAAGAMYSTVDDLARWDQSLTEGKLIGPESYKAMFTPGKGNYAFGWIVRDYEGHKLIGHGGGIHGFSTSILRFPEDKLCVVVLCNVVPARVDPIGMDLAKIALGLPLSTTAKSD